MSLPNLALAQSCTWHGGAVRHYARPPAASNACPSTDALTLNTMVAHSFSRRLSICARARSRSTNGCRVRHVRVSSLCLSLWCELVDAHIMSAARMT